MPTPERLLIAALVATVWMSGTIYWYPQFLEHYLKIQAHDATRTRISARAARIVCFSIVFWLWWTLALSVVVVWFFSLFVKPPPSSPQ